MVFSRDKLPLSPALIIRNLGPTQSGVDHRPQM